MDLYKFKIFCSILQCQKSANLCHLIMSQLQHSPLRFWLIQIWTPQVLTPTGHLQCQCLMKRMWEGPGLHQVIQMASRMRRQFKKQTVKLVALNSADAAEAVDKDKKESEGNVQTADIQLDAIKEVEDELEKSDELKKSNVLVLLPPQEECPICLEEYDAENPKMSTKCEHQFHLSCILEWMERSDTCPVCDQETVFNPAIDE
ncbi:hypothetical protein H5410_043761 [Solanum commersonii]|uniref:RING-type E3 ubiquitin transferase n=1 Tax=Solanum commersonii TaxID=4109 RepID=A0A9J5Y071_SOLCO|nr:hypothetical protein H5410_043761 [Solanum commersonii]